jgi:hypothetical protein
MTENPARLDAEQRSRGAEAKCIWWLRFKEYALLARRYRSYLGEIDIVAAHPALVGLTMRYDLMIVLPWWLPRHVQGAWID